jgi:DNA-binding MarR family transcriptional regulator
MEVVTLSEADPILERPGQSGLLSRLSRVGLLLDAFQHRCLDEFELRFIDFSVLRVLELRGALSPSELAEITLRSTGGMTQIVDRLIGAGLVGRTAHPNDRRRIVVDLTPRGRRLVAAAGKAYARERARVLGRLSEAELSDIDRAVRRLLQLFEEDAEAEAAS